MTLGDDLIAAKGSVLDLGNIIANLCTSIEKAQRFVLRDDIARAANELAYSKPSTLNAALPLCRLPYPKIWMENRGGLGRYHIEAPGRPVPLRQGALIENIGDDDQIGCITLAWVHRAREDGGGLAPTVCPFSIYFDWRPDGDVAEVTRSFADAVKSKNAAASSWIDKINEAVLKKTGAEHNYAWTEEVRARMLATNKLKGFADDAKEVEAVKEGLRHMQIGVSPYALGFLDTILSQAKPERAAYLLRNWAADTSGEASYIECFIAMLNSKNPVVEQMPTDLSRLNKSRAKSGRPPLLDHIETRLYMSRSQQHRADAAGIPRDAARQHLVRGHFKIRRTGVYWWSPFLRGDAKRAMERRQYEVA